jgi:hypothetical protein
MSKRATRKKSVTLGRDEVLYYSKLLAWTGSKTPLRFIWQVINSRPAVEGSEPQIWYVPSASNENWFYEVNIELRVCNCNGWRFKNTCSHLRIADCAARLRFELLSVGTVSTSDFRPASKVQHCEMHPSR